MKINEIIEKICEFHQPFESHGKARDVVLAGDPDQQCTGIVTTCCATFEVLEKAVELNANFIVSHESIFFGSRVDPEALERNQTYRRKMDFIKEHGLCIWRDHDHMHGNGAPFYPVRRQENEHRIRVFRKQGL